MLPKSVLSAGRDSGPYPILSLAIQRYSSSDLFDGGCGRLGRQDAVVVGAGDVSLTVRCHQLRLSRSISHTHITYNVTVLDYRA